ncbi:MAG TPA: DUF5615 family PIN-like protein [Chthoniobacterales bacterium]|nr:DUF5615 family PIN-like protein [Chthoniobacterales bacterium]
MPWTDIENIIADSEPTEREKRHVIDFARRKTKPRFYADEDFPQLATDILKRLLKADVLTVQDNRRRGQPDQNHIAEALRLGRILVTCDRDYLDERRFPLVHCPALVVCDFGGRTLGEILSTFRCLGSVFSAPQFFDKWTKIDARRDGWSEYARHLNGTTSRCRYRFNGARLQEWVRESQTGKER